MDRLPLIVKKDVLDAVRDRQLYGVGLLFLLAGALMGYILGNPQPGAPPGQVPSLTLLLLVFIGVVSAITLSYNQIVGKRSSGELRVLLGLPFSRFEVVYGTAIGRFLLVGSLSMLAMVTAVVVATMRGATVGLEATAIAVVAAVAIVAIFVSVSVGLSASSKNPTRASVGAFGLFMLLMFRLWELVPFVGRFVANGLESPEGPPPEWATLWKHLSPLAAVRNVAVEFNREVANSLSGYAAPIPRDQPWFVEPWVGALLVVLWVVVPVTFGYVQLQGADL